LIVWARDLGWSAVLNNLVIDAYFLIGAFLEERKLVREYGMAYVRYRRQVSMFFPWKWVKARLGNNPLP